MMYKKIFSFLVILLKSKFIFKKPAYSRVIFIGKPSFHYDLFSKKNFINLIANQNNTIAIWGEYYNFQILFRCLIKFRFSIIDYCEEYINQVNPKVVITLLDNNDIIYKLKLKKIKKIAIQQAYRYGSNILDFKKEKINKNSLDYLFAYNKSIGDVYRKKLDANIDEIGSFLLNDMNLNKNSKISYKYLYISSYRKINKSNQNISPHTSYIKFQDQEKKLVKLLYEYLVKKNQKLFILGGNKYSYDEEYNYYESIIRKNKNWKLIKPKKRHYSFPYKCLMKSKNVIGIDSSLLYESLSLKKKTIFFNCRVLDNYLYKNRYFAWPLRMKSEGLFWTNKLNKKKVASVLERIDKMSLTKWNKIVEKHNYLYSSDKGNKKFRKLLDKLI
jgi:surface carbohydrate biosynthesis protein